MVSNYQKGVWSEWLISIYLQMLGYKILSKRFKTKLGEIDLIARKKDVLVFVEVKNRKSLSDALGVVDRRTQQRIINAAKLFVQKYPHEGAKGFRFDVIALYSGLCVQHIRNAFNESEIL